VEVEWVSGMSPTAYFYDSEGIVKSQRELTDMDLDELMTIFNTYKFEPLKQVLVFPDTPTATDTYGGHRYELFVLQNYFDAALEFARSRKFNDVSGYLVTVGNHEENEFVAGFLSKNDAVSAWLGAKDDEEGHWKWIEGPENGIKFWEGTFDGHPMDGVYVNWKEGEPNNVDNEDCAAILADGIWNDAVCDRAKISLIVEFGTEPLEVTTEKSNTEKSDL